LSSFAILKFLKFIHLNDSRKENIVSIEKVVQR